MNRICLLLIGAIIIFITSSFQTEVTSKFVGKWQASKIDIPSYDSTLAATVKDQIEQIEALDEVDSGMIERYHTDDLEVIKQKAIEEVKAQPEQTREEMKKRTAEISFTLMEHNKGESSFGYGTQNIRWYLGDDNTKLFFDPFDDIKNAADSNNQVMIFDIVALTPNNMRLRVHQQKGKQEAFVEFYRVQATDPVKKK